MIKTVLKIAVVSCIALNIYMILVRCDYIDFYSNDKPVQIRDSVNNFKQQNTKADCKLDLEYQYEEFVE
jgi:hypothetical protein